MAVIWGLDLHEMQWSKFKSSYMFNRIYHLRRVKMVIYQIAMILCVCSESVGTAALSDYVDQQSFIEKMNNLAAEYNDDFVGIASYNIFVGIAVATIFGAAFFFDLFWPERHESRSVRLSWKISAVAVTVMCFADAIAMTVIVATRHAYISGVDAAEASRLLEASIKNPNLYYRHNPKCIASVVLLWPGMIATIGSCYLLIASQNHNDKHGVFSRYGREKRDAVREVKAKTQPTGVIDSEETAV
ncbi:conserved hypothetical protein [Talaromyces stipitatus ATCC 10500]|uniref:Uncharacterized protein n=1 Tax=Talaromyces stipitatus (strain ATCC 10500 / CBS 375.48 / QM 6759 / NRRL 1006) TaxID=441959 RepID=B8M5D5_TALSN|nr:uncharacterized protein TSTA_030100 [Talaromyces stipitatus ATCC 10500]EED19741.1 conserved hypothetical protein [Talaromyces stipitatus ATCC 10500]